MLRLDPETTSLRSRLSKVSGNSLRPPSVVSGLPTQRPESRGSRGSAPGALDDDMMYMRGSKTAYFVVEEEDSKIERQVDEAVDYMKYMPTLDLVEPNAFLAPNSTDSDYEGSPTGQQRPAWLMELSVIMHGRKGSRIGKIVNTFFLCVLLLSIASFCLGTMQYFSFHPQWKVAIFAVDFVCVVIFTIEYILRVIAAESWSELVSPLLIIDLISVVPFYIELIVISRLGGDFVDRMTSIEGIAALRTLRLIRTFRILKFVRKSAKLAIILQAVKSSLDGIAVLLVTVSILIVFYSSLLYYAEQSDMTFEKNTRTWVYSDGSASPYQSIPECFYYLVGSLTGNPPETPKSPYSKLVIAFCMMTSVFILAFPLTVITISYSKTIRAFTQAQKQKRERRERERAERLALQEERIAARLFAAAERARQIEEEDSPGNKDGHDPSKSNDNGGAMTMVTIEDSAEGEVQDGVAGVTGDGGMQRSGDSKASNDTLTTSVEVQNITNPPSNANGQMSVMSAVPASSGMPLPSFLFSSGRPTSPLTPALGSGVTKPAPSAPRLAASFTPAKSPSLPNMATSLPAQTNAAETPPAAKLAKPDGNMRSSVNVLTAVNALKKPLLKPKPKLPPTAVKPKPVGAPAATTPASSAAYETALIQSPSSSVTSKSGIVLAKSVGQNVNVGEMYAAVAPLVPPGKGAPKDLEIRILDWSY
ncbi:hypothetical protein HDU67_010314, partial [Dinochytrium kinnereticum]